jgi:hypothetical protein
MKTIIAAAFALTLIAPAAQAATTIYKIVTVCRWDMDQYCKGIPKKHIRDLRECLAKREKDLLPQCQDHYKEAVP